MAATASQLTTLVSDSPKPGHLPAWLRVSLPAGDASGRFRRVRTAASNDHLHTVCQEAHCPNRHECWGQGTATFMVAGRVCTRACRFCAVATRRTPPPLDPLEPEHLAATIATMDLAHVVITVVNRDDLPDGGARHYRRCIQAVHTRVPGVTLELLCSDLAGDFAALACLLDQTPLCVFAHNVECVPRLDGKVRDRRADFEQSVAVLTRAKQGHDGLLTKSGLMLGLGETDAEVADAMVRLRAAGVDILTLGQYLAPSSRHYPVRRFVPPEQFDRWHERARGLGFRAVAAGPLVRSSYRAGQLLREARAGLLGMKHDGHRGPADGHQRAAWQMNSTGRGSGGTA